MSPIRTRGLARLLALAATTVLGLLAGFAAAPARAQDPVADCTAQGGIYVQVVEQGTELVAGCSQAQTGMARLLELTSVQTAGQGFICQIAGRPDQCVGTPAGDEAYWSYWWWRDGAWRYANIGGSYRGVPGSIEAWHYSVGEPPPFAPGDPQATSVTSGRPADPVPAADPGLPAWAPTAITVAILTVAAAGYLIWRRRAGR